MPDTPQSLSLTAEELALINNALNEILHGPEAIPAWEFQTRVGVERAKAEALLRRLGELIMVAKGQV